MMAAWAQEVATFDFPSEKQGGNLPAGLRDWPKESSAELTSIEIPLLPLNDEGALLVTVVFHDSEGSLIRARWSDATGITINIVDNISENVEGWNQRTFEVSYDLLQQAGSLILETDAEKHPVRRVELAWTWPAGVFMSPSARAVKFIPHVERLVTEHDLTVTAAGPTPDAWSAGIWRAALQETIETLDEPLQFTVPMDTAPEAAIFRVKALGVPLDRVESIWVNGRKLAALAFETPALGEAGYYKTADGELRYAGWRNAAAVIPAGYLRAGENSIVLDARKGSYIKDALLELNFEKEGAPFAVKDAPPAAGGPAAPAPLPGPAVIGVPPQSL